MLVAATKTAILYFPKTFPKLHMNLNDDHNTYLDALADVEPRPLAGLCAVNVAEGAEAEAVSRAGGGVHVAVHRHRPPPAAPARLEGLAHLQSNRNSVSTF